MKKVLILTYYWPPGSGPGVQRWLKFCKYLPEFGWEPLVITVKDGSYPNLDPSLEDDIPKGIKVYKTKTFEPFGLYNLIRGKKGKSVEVAMGSLKGNPSLFSRLANYIRSNFFIPDARLGWNRYSFPAALKVIRKESPGAIITTGPPHSTHLVGERLNKILGLPWVADFRDPWTTIYYNDYLLRTPASKQKDKQLEDRVLANATAVITATEGLSLELSDRSRNTYTLHNGYDEEDFLDINLKPSEHFSLSYIGNLKANQDLPMLWKAIAELARSEVFRSRFKLEITGNIHENIRHNIKKAGIDSLVRISAFVPHKEAVTRMISAHMLLLPVPQSSNNKIILTGKLFEYLATRRPILAVGPPEGNAGKVLRNCEKDAMIDYDDQGAMQEQLEKYFNRYLKDPAPVITGSDVYLQFSRRGTTEKLAGILDEISKS